MSILATPAGGSWRDSARDTKPSYSPAVRATSTRFARMAALGGGSLIADSLLTGIAYAGGRSNVKHFLRSSAEW